MNALAVRDHLMAFSALLAHDAQAGLLNMRDLQVLACVVKQGKPVGVGSVADMLGVSTAVVSRVAGKLVDRGMLARFDNPANRRIALLEPTPAGQALDDRVRAYHQSSGQTASR